MFKNGLLTGHFFLRAAGLWYAVIVSLFLHGLLLYSTHLHLLSPAKPLKLVLDQPIRLDLSYLGDPGRPLGRQDVKPVISQGTQAHSPSLPPGGLPSSEGTAEPIAGSVSDHSVLLQVDEFPDASIGLPAVPHFGFSHKRRSVFEPPLRPQNQTEMMSASRWLDEKVRLDIRNQTVANLLADLYKLDKDYDAIECQLGPDCSCDVDHGPTLALIQRHQNLTVALGAGNGMTLRFSLGQWHVDAVHSP